MKNHDARNRSFKITIPYFMIGCAWILFSDKWVQLSFTGESKAFLFSTLKGFIYVFITSVLIYALTYLAMKEIINKKEALGKANEELIRSSKQYKELYEDYIKKQALLKSLIDSIPDLIFYKDTNSVYLGCNLAFENFVGKREQDIIGHTDKDIFSAKEAEYFINTDADMLIKNILTKREETVTYPCGKEVIFETLKTPYYDESGKIIGLIGISRDITERKNREERIKYISYHDNQTGIYNRTYFDEARVLLDDTAQLPISVIIGDVDGMKLINDTFGRAKGDALLLNVANIIKQCVKAEDIVARTGGDEFSILMPHTDEQAVKAVADRIRTLCKESPLEENIFISIALGYATKSRHDQSLNNTIMLAEDFMYRRKLLEQKSLHNDYLAYFKTTMFEKSDETEKHAERLSMLSKRLGEDMGLSENELDELELVAMLHDIGKISIDKDILTKAGELSDEDWGEIKKHPEVGYRIANSTLGLSHIAKYILYHHEHWDGSGYPLGLSGDNIPLLSRIVSIVDCYDAMTQDRAYRKAMPKEVAINEILKQKGTQFDPEIVDIFVNKVLPSEQ